MQTPPPKSLRSNKRAMPHAEALERMRAEAGTQFDPKLFALFEEVVASITTSDQSHAFQSPRTVS